MNIDDMLDIEPEVWKPAPGDKLIGALVASRRRVAGYNPYMVYTIQEGQKLWDVHAFHDVLERELAGQDARQGDQIGIKYTGKPEGKDYEHYRVIVQKPDPTATSAIGDEPF